MGLISKTVMMKWEYKTKKYYENKGYIYTKWKDEFEVNVEDLSIGSHILVEVKCDNYNCTTPIIKSVKWQDYLKCVKKDSKYFCNKCSNNLFGVEKRIKVALSNGSSFEQWCIDNNRQDILDRWDYELNNCKPNEICYGGNVKKYWLKCIKHPEHKSELKNVNTFTNGEKGAIRCNRCNSFAQWGIDNLGKDFLEKYWDYEKNDESGINPWKVNYGSHYKKVWIKCQEKDYHESYFVFCNAFTNNNSRCPYCSSNKVHPLDSLGKLLEDRNLLYIWSDKNKKYPYKYSPFNAQKVWWKCLENKHEDYYRKINGSNTCDFRCPECVQERDESFLQEKVRLYLESLNNGEYIILHEYKCFIIPINPKTNRPLPFDNEVKELKLIIEVHGRQHYKIVTWHKSLAKCNNITPEYELHYQKLKDRYKRFIAYKQGYNYIEIPYWTDNKKETWKQLIDDKIKEIG